MLWSIQVSVMVAIGTKMTVAGCMVIGACFWIRPGARAETGSAVLMIWADAETKGAATKGSVLALETGSAHSLSGRPSRLACPHREPLLGLSPHTVLLRWESPLLSGHRELRRR